MNMKLKEMKTFAALTDEERAEKIRLRQCELLAMAVEEYYSWGFVPHETPLDCGRCERPIWGVDKEGQENLNVYCDSDGNITSDVFEMVEIGMLECIHCNEKPKPPQSFIEEYIEREGGV